MANHRRDALIDLLVNADLVLSPADIRPGSPPVEIACVDGVPQQLVTYDFVRSFIHRDWVDGENLVQAGKTPDEDGFNDRFHKIEADLDALGANVLRGMTALNALRAQVRVCLSEVVAAITAANKDDAKDAKEQKEQKENKENKEQKDNKEVKENKDQKDSKETKEDKDQKEAKEDEDKPPKEETKDTLGAKEKEHDGPVFPLPVPGPAPMFGRAADALPDGGARVFITPGERPRLGERALNMPREE